VWAGRLWYFHHLNFNGMELVLNLPQLLASRAQRSRQYGREIQRLSGSSRWICISFRMLKFPGPPARPARPASDVNSVFVDKATTTTFHTARARNFSQRAWPCLAPPWRHNCGGSGESEGEGCQAIGCSTGGAAAAAAGGGDWRNDAPRPSSAEQKTMRPNGWRLPLHRRSC
jgi:hypothetical protein